MESKRKGIPCRANGSVLLWMNYAIIVILEERLKDNMNIFEYGSCYSTIFFSKYVSHITSVEYNKEWYNLIQASLPDNAELTCSELDYDGEYCRTIHKTDSRYDVVIVDGSDRVNCIKQSIDRLSDQGIIILDDSFRERYQEGISFAKEQGFRAISFEGLKPAGNRIDKSTIFYKDNNCFDI